MTSINAAGRWGGRGLWQGGRVAEVAVALATLLLVIAAPSSAQSIADRVAGVRDGKVRMSYATRPEVCGSGRNISISRNTDDWEIDCEPGPARVVLTWRAGALIDVQTHVGGRWREARGEVVDLGTVPAAEAAEYLLSLARSERRHGEEAVFPATLADSVEVWPHLFTIARSEDLPTDTRKASVFWLGQAAGERIAADLAGLVDDENVDSEVQEHAVFALSQLRRGEGVPALLEVARSHRSPEVRKKALFWLGQSGDPRAIALFEEILLRG